MGEATASTQPNADAFIARWTAREGGAERANYGMFLTELCALIEVDPPDPAGVDTERNDYVFERSVRFHSEDDKTSVGRIDLYKKGSFVLEAKQSRLKGAKKEVAGQEDLFSADAPDESRGRRGADRAWDVLMLNAKRQAEDYARALPTSHGWPPFVLVADVGHCIEVYADFSGHSSRIVRASAFSWTTCGRMTCASGCTTSGSNRRRLTRRGSPRRQHARSPSGSLRSRRRWKPRSIRPKRWRIS